MAAMIDARNSVGDQHDHHVLAWRADVNATELGWYRERRVAWQTRCNIERIERQMLQDTIARVKLTKPQPGPVEATPQTLRKRSRDQIAAMQRQGFLLAHHVIAAEQYSVVVEGWDSAIAASGTSLDKAGGSGHSGNPDMFAHMSRNAYGLWEKHYRGWAWWLSINGVWLPVGAKSDGHIYRKRRQFKCGQDIMRAVVIDNISMCDVERRFVIPRKTGRILVRELLGLWDRMGSVRLSNRARPIDVG